MRLCSVSPKSMLGLLHSEDALELSEYALMLALLALALLLGIGVLRNAISNRFSYAASSIDT